MEEYKRIDISQYSFDQFISFMFERDVPPEAEKRHPWYWNMEVTYAPKAICSYYVQLFRQPEFLVQRFSKAQLDEGFWAIQGPNLDCAVDRVLWDTDLPFAAREECVRSMFDLFRLIFANEPLDTSVQMWWDSLCYDWHCGNRNRDSGGEDLKMQDVMFETLAAILSLDSPICQRAALHGLGHLHHPGTQKLIQQYLREHPSLSEEQREYAIAAAAFKVM